MPDLLIDHRGHILEITLNRPEKRNSLTPEMLHQLADCLGEFGQSEQTTILILKGSGAKLFSAGYDISRIPAPGTVEADKFALKKPLDLAVAAVANFPFPTIAMLNGSVFGGGCELAFACAFRYAADHIIMCMPPAKLGLVYSVEGLERIRKVIGISHLKKMIYTARQYGVDDLLRFGAIDEICPADSLEAKVLELANEMGELAPLAHRGHKWIMDRLEKPQLNPAEQEEAKAWLLRSYRSQDAREAKQAFAQKRPAVFSGR